MVDENSHANQFNALDENIQAEIEKWQKLGDNLVEQWRQARSGMIFLSETPFQLETWRKNLTGGRIMEYVHTFSSTLRTMLLHCTSEISNPSNGYVVVVENQPIIAEFKVCAGSLYEQEQDIGNFAKLQDHDFYHALGASFQDPCAPFALPYIADSLRTGELNELPKLDLERVTPSIIKVTLDMKVDYGLG